MILKLKRTPGIYLTGFMGSGKTTVGRMLAEKIGWRFVDIDEDIETAQKTSISSLFETVGEAEFRRIEAEAIRRRVLKVQSGHPMVVALGGGTFTQPAIVELLHNSGVTIWLAVAFAAVKRRVDLASHPPLAPDPQKFQELFEARRVFYEKAEYRVPVAEDNSRLALEHILELPIFHE